MAAALASTVVDVEWLALTRGWKPAIRLTCDPASADVHAARFEARGAAVRRAHWQAPDARPPQTILYIARTLEAAAALAAAEEPLIARVEGADKYAASVEVGRLLGYPACCVEAFVGRAERVREIAGLAANRGIRKRYFAALEARVPAPRWELNTLLLDERVRLVTFEPCTFRCGFALRLAEATFAAITEASPHVAARLRAGLAVDLALDASGARAIVERHDGRVLRARPPTSEDGQSGPLPLDAAFAAKLVDRAVEPDGAPIDPDGLVVIAFAR